MVPEALSSPKKVVEWSGLDGGPRDAVTGLSAPLQSSRLLWHPLHGTVDTSVLYPGHENAWVTWGSFPVVHFIPR